MNEHVLVLYHGSCPDGFGGAYAARQALGPGAEYRAVFHGDPPPPVGGREVYIIDFSYPGDVLRAMEQQAARLVVLDHHLGVREAVESVREHVFDNEHSGCGIAWRYFHHDTPLPRLLAYIEDNDLFKRSLPDWKAVGAYVSTLTLDFGPFDAAVRWADTEDGFAELLAKGRAYDEYLDHLCASIAAGAERVRFDEFEVLAVNAPRILKARIAHRLLARQGPLAIVWYPHHDQWHFSLVGSGAVDCSKVAQRRGGNGHPNASAFRLPLTEPFPFTRIEQRDEHPGD